MAHQEITSFDDIIDSRDVIARIEELEGYRDDAASAEDVSMTFIDAAGATHNWTPDWTVEAAEELRILKEFASEGEGFADWEHGETMVRDSYFETYAQELAEDCGMLDKANSWPLNCIDWEQAARELKYDYTSADFNGVTYWGRS
jgi:hypothetical protein